MRALTDHEIQLRLEQFVISFEKTFGFKPKIKDTFQVVQNVLRGKIEQYTADFLTDFDEESLIKMIQILIALDMKFAKNMEAEMDTGMVQSLDESKTKGRTDAKPKARRVSKSNRKSKKTSPATH